MLKNLVFASIGAFIFLTSITFSSCQKNKSDEYITVPNPTISSNIIYFGKLLKELPGNDLLNEFEGVQKTHPYFSELFKDQLIEAKTDDQLLEELSLIHKDSSYLLLYNEVEASLGDLSDIKPEIDQALENYLDVFSLPQRQLPDVYTFISGFAYQAFVFDDGGKNGVGIGLDMYLGNDFPYQKVHPKNPSFSQYLVRTYNKEHLVRKMVEVLVEDQMAPPRQSNFLSFIIWGGKKLYLIDRILDFKSDTIITEYTQEQLDWCNNNEEEMWKFFFEKELFFETDLRKFNKLIIPAPTSPEMPAESPGQTGNYIGWQIVRSYMSRYPSTTVSELLSYQDSQKFLDLSKYKPTRK